MQNFEDGEKMLKTKSINKHFQDSCYNHNNLAFTAAGYKIFSG